MELVNSSEEDCTSYNNNGEIVVKSCYLPHHAVVKESSSTTQLRIVFDASRKTTNGKSLNDILFPGPTLHNDLPSIITNWRFHRVAFAADLQQMFRQILVDHNDSQFQRVVWRNDPSEPLREYYLKTVTFGTTSAPYLAIRTVQQLASDFQSKYPEAYHFIINSIYVDDVFGGADDVPQAIKLQCQLIDVFSEAKFHLRKWISNYEELLKTVSENDREIKLPLALNADQSVKTLGIVWQPEADEFRFQFNFELNCASSDQPLTKRSVLSTTARLFDPLGLITPVILPAKLLLRDLWCENLDWDDTISKSLATKWYNITENLQSLIYLKIPRWISTTTNSTTLQFHGFCDASKNAYAATIYLRSTDTSGLVHCHLLTSKSRIAPIKATTIPRLELMGALLLAELYDKINKNWQNTNKPDVYVWSDSEIVLHWLNGDSNRWEVFVANRVTKIKEIIPASKWRYVSTEINPADLATRGSTVEDLRSNDLWWSGPAFLRSNLDILTQPTFKQRDDITDFKIVHMNRVSNSDSIEILNRFSNYHRLIRTTAIIKRLAQKARHESTTSFLSVQQLQNSSNFWIRIVQQYNFSLEYNAFTQHQPIPKTSKLLNLNPFLDDYQLMRVRGRLENSSLPYREKFPIILPPQSQLTKLIILDYHRMTLHGGTQLVLTWLRKKFWIINARKTVRFMILRCVICYRMRAKAGEQRMGVLPSVRVNSSFVFNSTGLDFAGPIEVKASRCRSRVTYKGYIAIFVCMAVRAIHIELVGDLSTATFLQALKRFLARRNMCSEIYSDNGKTFVGATNQLKLQEQQWKDQIDNEVQPYLANRAITWHFIPPASPHFGGVWEASVKSIKYHLKRVCGSLSYTYEEWSTVLTEIEGILNSRPLCAYTSDPDDFTSITPNHFLNGDIARAPPETDVSIDNRGLPARLRELMELKQSFWRRWSREYLSQLQSRPKWLNSTKNLEINDLVLIKDERLPPLNWMMGRIVEVHPGSDGLVRVASVRTKNGFLKRPITKLCLLPIDHVDQ